MKVYLLCGLAFSGKTTLARAIVENTGARLVSLDEINARRGLHGGLGIPVDEWARTHHVALELVRDSLEAGQSVVVDDTNCFRFLRDNYRRVAGRFGVSTLVVHADVPVDLVRARRLENACSLSRAPVTEPVLIDLIEKFEPPASDEETLVFRQDCDPTTWVAAQFPGSSNTIGQLQE